MTKDFLYVGHYVDTNGQYILKIGTTNDLDRRRDEHTRNYRKAHAYTMPQSATFEYDGYIPLSKYNALRYEDKNRIKLIAEGIGEFVRNDRFCCPIKPNSIIIKIRREYEIML